MFFKMKNAVIVTLFIIFFSMLISCGEGFELLLDDPPRTIGPRIVTATPSDKQANVALYNDDNTPVTLKIVFDMTMNV